jgi:hypothetical protein
MAARNVELIIVGVVVAGISVAVCHRMMTDRKESSSKNPAERGGPASRPECVHDMAGAPPVFGKLAGCWHVRESFRRPNDVMEDGADMIWSFVVPDDRTLLCVSQTALGQSSVTTFIAANDGSNSVTRHRVSASVEHPQMATGRIEDSSIFIEVSSGLHERIVVEGDTALMEIGNLRSSPPFILVRRPMVRK